MTVEGLDPTARFSFDVAGPVVVAPGESATLDVRVTPLGCDPLAATDEPTGFAPRLRLRVGGEELTTPVRVPGERRQVLRDVVVERCTVRAGELSPL